MAARTRRLSRTAAKPVTSPTPSPVAALCATGWSSTASPTPPVEPTGRYHRELPPVPVRLRSRNRRGQPAALPALRRSHRAGSPRTTASSCWHATASSPAWPAPRPKPLSCTVSDLIAIRSSSALPAGRRHHRRVGRPASPAVRRADQQSGHGAASLHRLRPGAGTPRRDHPLHPGLRPRNNYPFRIVDLASFCFHSGQAEVAVMRKLITLANALLRADREWQPVPPARKAVS